MTAACIQGPDWTGDAHRNDHRLTRAGGMLRHLERPSPWLSGGQDDATDLLTATEDRPGQLPDDRRAAYPAERAAQPLSPRPLPLDELEVLPCL
jgi:hypothetical protein